MFTGVQEDRGVANEEIEFILVNKQMVDGPLPAFSLCPRCVPSKPFLVSWVEEKCWGVGGVGSYLGSAPPFSACRIRTVSESSVGSRSG